MIIATVMVGPIEEDTMRRVGQSSQRPSHLMLICMEMRKANAQTRVNYLAVNQPRVFPLATVANWFASSQPPSSSLQSHLVDCATAALHPSETEMVTAVTDLRKPSHRGGQHASGVRHHQGNAARSTRESLTTLQRSFSQPRQQRYHDSTRRCPDPNQLAKTASSFSPITRLSQSVTESSFRTTRLAATTDVLMLWTHTRPPTLYLLVRLH